MQGLRAAAAGAFTPRRTTGSRLWEPPAVEHLQAALPQYEVTDLIARGGMGAVYKGTQRALKRPVAIKVLPPEIDEGDMQFAERFKREAQAMAQLSHPNIVAVYDAGETAEGLLYFVMELVEGTDVAALLRDGNPLPVAQAVEITGELCDALAFAHEAGIIHRDIKPSNVMLDARGRVKVADFGLAKALNTEGGTLLTRSDMALGTPDYISPEAQVPGMKLDGRADLYAVGVMLYQMLTGRLPRGRFDPPSGVVPQVDKRLDAIVDKALQTDREKRYTTARELKRDVEGVAAAGRGTPPSRSLMKPLVAAAGVVLLGAGAWLLREEPEGAPSTAAGMTTAPLKLWNGPQQLPQQKGVSWEDGVITLQNASLRHPARARDVVLRASLRIGPQASHSQLHVRSQFERNSEDPARSTWYAIGVGTAHDGVGLTKWVAGQRELVNGWPLPRPYKPGEWIRLEIRVQGNVFTVTADGKLLGTATDDAIPEPGGVVIANQMEGQFRDVEFINLDGLSEAEVLKAAGPSPSPSLPVSSSAASPAQWVKVFTKPEDVPPESLGARDSHWSEGWLVPGRTPLRLVCAEGGANQGVRARFKFRGGDANENFIQLRAQGPAGYVFRVLSGGKCTISLMKPGPSGALNGAGRTARETEVIATASLPKPLQAGEEYTLEFLAIGSRLIGRCNGTVICEGTDTRLPEGETSLFGYSAIRDVEVVELDQLPEAEALKAAGVGAAEVPDPIPGPDGRVRFPVGVWTRLHGREKDAKEIPANPKNKVDGEWMLLEDVGYGWLVREIDPMTNLGLRAEFRGQRVNAGEFPQMNLRGLQGRQPSVNLHISAGKLQIRTTEPGFPVLAEAPLREPLTQGKPYRMEFYAFGRQLFARVNGQMLTAETDLPPAPGNPSLFGANMDWFKDVHVMNLYGHSAEEALKVAGVDIFPHVRPFTAGKDAPFINSLGMKFVPVPITGGPTDGRLVLFSIWETRVQDYEAFARAKSLDWRQAPFAQEPTHPAVNVSWQNAVAFCTWLTETEQADARLPRTLAYRLPSDHEWSCAAGIGGEEDASLSPHAKVDTLPKRYVWGTAWPPPPNAGNFSGEESADRLLNPGQRFLTGYRDAFPYTAPVGSFPANPLGLHDLAGNVFEWCSDWHGPGQDRRGFRSSAFNCGQMADLFISHRMSDPPDNVNPVRGFRVVLAGAPTGENAATTDLPDAAPPKTPYPAGQWVSPFQQASDINETWFKEGATWQDGWITPGAGTNHGITLAAPNGRGKNWGVRARYRWAAKGTASLSLRRQGSAAANSVATYEFRVDSANAIFRRSQARGPGVPSEFIPLGEPAGVTLEAGDEVLVEAFAINGRLYGRVDGVTVQADTDGVLAEGDFEAAAMQMTYRDIQFINLDGLSESDALEAAGLPTVGLPK